MGEPRGHLRRGPPGDRRRNPRLAQQEQGQYRDARARRRPAGARGRLRRGEAEADAAVAASARNAVTMPPQRHALLIATDEYRDDSFQQLRAPAGDVDALAEVL